MLYNDQMSTHAIICEAGDPFVLTSTKNELDKDVRAFLSGGSVGEVVRIEHRTAMNATHIIMTVLVHYRIVKKAGK